MALETTAAVRSGPVVTATAPSPPAGHGDVLPMGEAYAAAIAGLPGMGPARMATVLGRWSPAEAWERLRVGDVRDEADVLRALGPRHGELVARWRAEARSVDVGGVGRALAVAGVGVVLMGSAEYPAALIGDVEPPAVLFHLGPLALAGAPRVAIVGTRRCSSTGAGVAFELGRDLAAAGVVVVSGLAAGIDGAAHRGVLAACGAPPVGVVGSGLDVVYPVRHRDLWRDVGERGLLLSEAPLGARPERWRFPARNRIIAGLADLVIVVESHRRGGSLHTVDEADRRGVDVMAVPGSVRNPAAAGTNELLAEGRAPVCSIDDVLVALGLRAGAGSGSGAAGDRRAQPEAGDLALLDAIGWQAGTLDDLVSRTGVDLVRLAPGLERLCETGWLARSGGWYERVGAPGGKEEA
jgi:DNA processing protein